MVAYVTLIVGLVLIVSVIRMQQRMREGVEFNSGGMLGPEQSSGLSQPLRHAGRSVRSRFDRRPFLPKADQPPAQAMIPLQRVEERLEEYVTDGLRAVQIHLMQASRGTGWSTQP